MQAWGSGGAGRPERPGLARRRAPGNRRRTTGWVLGRVAGTPVVLAPSWLLIAGFLTYLFVPNVRAAAPGLGTVATVLAAAGFPLMLALSVLLHELGHGLTARRLGIPVTEYVVTLWGGHTQFDREIASPAHSALVSVAGPLVNGVLALLAWWAAGAATGFAALLLFSAALANGFVALFNVLPGLPLDGGRVLEALVWQVTGKRWRGTLAAGWVGRVVTVAFAAIALGRPLLLGRQPSIVTAVVVAMLGAMLWGGAGQAIRFARVQSRAEGLDLLALARPAVTAPLTATVAQLDGLAAAPGAVVVLVDGQGTPTALVDPVAFGAVPAALRAGTAATAVAVPVPPKALLTERSGLAAVRAVAEAGPFGVLLDRGPGTPRILGVLYAAAVAHELRARGRP